MLTLWELRALSLSLLLSLLCQFQLVTEFKHNGAAAAGCSWETVKLAQGGTVTRPVVRLELGGRPVILTRIQPSMKNTSMLIRWVPVW